MSKRQTLTKQEKVRLVVGVAGFSAAIGIFVGIAHAEGLWINTTDSMPEGFWLEISPHPARSGDVVLLCLPDTPTERLGRSRGYIARGPCPAGGEVLMKPIAATAGDDVEVTPSGISVNGIATRNSAQLSRDSLGRPLPAFPAGRYRVPFGELWLVSAHNARSFDSRYFGPVPEAAVRGTVRPLWVAE